MLCMTVLGSAGWGVPLIGDYNKAYYNRLFKDCEYKGEHPNL